MKARGWAAVALFTAALIAGSYLWSPVLGRLNSVLLTLGLLAFGGGFTVIPLIQQEVVERWGWLTTREFIDGIAMGQVTPGPIMITVTFVGYKVAGIVGAVTATAAAFFPSFAVLMGALPYYDRIKRAPMVQQAIAGVLAAFIGLLVFIFFQFARASVVDWGTALLAVAALVALWRNVSLLFIVPTAAIVSILML